MQSFTINNTKGFMSQLLKGNVFDDFYVRNVSIQTFANFDMDCKLNKDFISDEDKDIPTRDFCLWSEIKPYVFEIIKGSKTPKSFKTILSLPDEKCASISPNASALFININYDGNGISCITGCSQKNFSFDKALDLIWDQYVTDFFCRNNITHLA